MKTNQVTDVNASKTATAKGAVKNLNGEAVKKEPTTAEKVKEQQKEISKILTPSAKAKIKRLETLQILADKYDTVSTKYDELTNFMAGNDNTDAQMKFVTPGYSFTVRNPFVIGKILEMVEAEFSLIVEKAEKEVLAFNI